MATPIDALQAATAVLQAHGFANIIAMPLHPGAAGDKKSSFEIRASLVYRSSTEYWIAVVTHGGAALGNCSDASGEDALQQAMNAARVRLVALLKLLES